MTGNQIHVVDCCLRVAGCQSLLSVLVFCTRKPVMGVSAGFDLDAANRDR